MPITAAPQLPDAPKPEKPAEKTFTQAELNAIIAERFARMKEKEDEERSALQKKLDAQAAALKEVEDAKAAAEAEKAERDRQRALEKGEFEKALEIERTQALAREKKLQADLAELTQKAEAAERARQQTAIESTLLAEASAKRSKNPKHVLALLKAEHTFSVDSRGSVLVDGNPSLTVSQIVEDFLTTYPELVTSDFPASRGAGTAPPAPPAAPGQKFTPAQLKDDAFVKAHLNEIWAEVNAEKKRLASIGG